MEEKETSISQVGEMKAKGDSLTYGRRKIVHRVAGYTGKSMHMLYRIDLPARRGRSLIFQPG